MREFRFPLVCFGGGGEGADICGGFTGVYEGGFVGGRCDRIGVAELATAEYSVDLEVFKGFPVVLWEGSVACTDVWHIVQVHLSNVGWGDRVYFIWCCKGGRTWMFVGSHQQGGGAWFFVWRLSQY